MESIEDGRDDLQDQVRKSDSCEERKGNPNERERGEVKKQETYYRMLARPVTNIVPTCANGVPTRLCFHDVSP